MDDPELRATIAAATAIVGVNNNRWHVNDVAKWMIHGTKMPAERLAFEERFKALSQWQVQHIGAYLEASQLDPILLAIFRPDHDEKAS